jgi:hypothetical protein
MQPGPISKSVFRLRGSSAAIGPNAPRVRPPERPKSPKRQPPRRKGSFSLPRSPQRHQRVDRCEHDNHGYDGYGYGLFHPANMACGRSVCQ